MTGGFEVELPYPGSPPQGETLADVAHVLQTEREAAYALFNGMSVLLKQARAVPQEVPDDPNLFYNEFLRLHRNLFAEVLADRHQGRRLPEEPELFSDPSKVRGLREILGGLQDELYRHGQFRHFNSAEDLAGFLAPYYADIAKLDPFNFGTQMTLQAFMVMVGNAYDIRLHGRENARGRWLEDGHAIDFRRLSENQFAALASRNHNEIYNALSAAANPDLHERPVEVERTRPGYDVPLDEALDADNRLEWRPYPGQSIQLADHAEYVMVTDPVLRDLDDDDYHELLKGQYIVAINGGLIPVERVRTLLQQHLERGGRVDTFRVQKENIEDYLVRGGEIGNPEDLTHWDNFPLEQEDAIQYRDGRPSMPGGVLLSNLHVDLLTGLIIGDNSDIRYLEGETLYKRRNGEVGEFERFMGFIAKVKDWVKEPDRAIAEMERLGLTQDQLDDFNETLTRLKEETHDIISPIQVPYHYEDFLALVHPAAMALDQDEAQLEDLLVRAEARLQFTAPLVWDWINAELEKGREAKDQRGTSGKAMLAFGPSGAGKSSLEELMAVHCDGEDHFIVASMDRGREISTFHRLFLTWLYPNRDYRTSTQIGQEARTVLTEFAMNEQLNIVRDGSGVPFDRTDALRADFIKAGYDDVMVDGVIAPLHIPDKEHVLDDTFGRSRSRAVERHGEWVVTKPKGGRGLPNRIIVEKAVQVAQALPTVMQYESTLTDNSGKPDERYAIARGGCVVNRRQLDKLLRAKEGQLEKLDEQRHPLWETVRDLGLVPDDMLMPDDGYQGKLMDVIVTGKTRGGDYTIAVIYDAEAWNKAVKQGLLNEYAQDPTQLTYNRNPLGHHEWHREQLAREMAPDESRRSR